MGRWASYFAGHPFRIFVHCGQTLALAHYLFNHQYSFGWGYGPSMLPTFLVDGDIIIFDKHHRRGRDVRVGDCVSYHIPVSPDEDGVKRIIGMPGDYVLMNSPGATSDRMLQVSAGLACASIMYVILISHMLGAKGPLLSCGGQLAVVERLPRFWTSAPGSYQRQGYR